MLLTAPESFNTHPREKLRRANRKNPCPVCHRTGCGFNSSVVLCWRVSAGSTHQTEKGAYLHVQDGHFNDYIYIPTPVMQVRSPLEKRTAVYNDLLDELKLHGSHYKQLSARGLSDASITAAKYKSIPSKLEARQICDKLKKNYKLDYVPGFFRDDKLRLMNVNGSGIFIPYRTVTGEIQAMQIRSDNSKIRYIWFSSIDLEKGASSGAPIHYSRPLQGLQEVFITEGALKSDCIAEHLNTTVVALGGVTSVDYEVLFQDIADSLPTVTTVVAAFDVDWKTNKHVQDALRKLISAGEKRFTVEMEDWLIEQGKGFDDYLLGRKQTDRLGQTGQTGQA